MGKQKRPPRQKKDADARWIAAMEWGARLGCHQMPERSLFFRGRQMPLCARCTGVWIGYFAAAILFVCGLRPPLWVCFCCAGAMLLDWMVQRLGWRKSTNLRRVLTGTLGGFGVLTAELKALLWLYGVLFGGA